MQPGYTLQVCAQTDIGLKRKCNEDSYFISDRNLAQIGIDNKHAVFAVADGMGGHAGGDVASQMAVRELAGRHKNGNGPSESEEAAYLKYMEKVIFSIHRRIADYGQTHPEVEGLGTTLSVLVLTGRKALMAHVGDSRIYRLREGRLEQMTRDHTLVGQFVEAGVMTVEEAGAHPLRHVMMQAVGHGIEHVFTRMEDLHAQDLFLLCSDGLHEAVPQSEIMETMLAGTGHGHICRDLLAKALHHGGPDNITVVAVRAAC